MKFIDEDIKKRILEEHGRFITNMITILIIIAIFLCWLAGITYVAHKGLIANTLIVAIGFPVWVLVWAVYYPTKWELIREAREALEKATWRNR